MTTKRAHRKNVPEWLATALSFMLLGLLFAAYFVFYRPVPAAAPASAPASGAVPPPTTALPAPAYTHPLAIGSARLYAAFAITAAEEEQGLSGTSSLSDSQGMLFIFGSDSVVPFWMKDMNYPLDIIWIGADKRVADITPDLAPSTYPNAYSSKVPIRYALEVPAGFAARNGIAVGSQVSF